MKKKLHTKKHSSHKRISPRGFLIRYMLVSFGVLTLLLGTKGILATTTRVHVLGVQTGPVLLADRGGDNSGGGETNEGQSGGGSNSGGSNSGGGSGSGSGDNHAQTNLNSSVGSLQSSVSGSTQVDCVGPDGKHFTTSFKDCSELNIFWHHSNFSFTPLSTSSRETETTSSTQQTEDQTTQPTLENNEHKTVSKLEVETANGKTKINLEQNGMKVKLEKEGSTVTVKAEKPDGTEVELQTKDALDSINKELETEGVEVSASTTSSNLVIRKGNTLAETELPISVDPISHHLTVTTPAGVRQVSILPDQAVNSLLSSNLLSSVTSQASSGSGAVQNVTLTQLNNNPAFAVQGISQKKLLGLFPVGFAKTAFVSATNGQVLQTNETLLNKILEALSF